MLGTDQMHNTLSQGSCVCIWVLVCRVCWYASLQSQPLEKLVLTSTRESRIIN